jgi:hypothetical protein
MQCVFMALITGAVPRYLLWYSAFLLGFDELSCFYSQSSCHCCVGLTGFLLLRMTSYTYNWIPGRSGQCPHHFSRSQGCVTGARSAQIFQHSKATSIVSLHTVD